MLSYMHSGCMYVQNPYTLRHHGVSQPGVAGSLLQPSCLLVAVLLYPLPSLQELPRPDLVVRGELGHDLGRRLGLARQTEAGRRAVNRGPSPLVEQDLDRSSTLFYNN